MKLVCIKQFDDYVIGKSYEYYTNFGGLNHFVIGESGSPFPFSGPVDTTNTQPSYACIDELDNRPVVFDYFTTIDIFRNGKLNELGI